MEVPFSYPVWNTPVDAKGLASAKAKAVADLTEMTAVANSTQYPYSAIARIDITWPSGNSNCSGFMNGPDLLVTAGHCLYNPALGGWPQIVFVLPARSPSGFPYGICQITKLYSSEGWTELELPEYDYGAVKIDTASCTGSPSSLGLQPPDSQNDSVPGPFTVTGYPKVDPTTAPMQQYTASASESSHTQRRFIYPVDTKEGVSGAPVYVPCDVGYCAVGIHVGSNTDGSGAVAVRISQANAVDFDQWRTEPPQKATRR